MTTDEAIKALTGEPIPDWQPTITTTGELPPVYLVCYWYKSADGLTWYGQAKEPRL